MEEFLEVGGPQLENAREGGQGRAEQVVAVLLFLSLAGTAATSLGWFTEAQQARLDQLIAWTFLVPVVGLLLAAAVLGERPTGWTLVELALVMTALGIAQRPRPAAPRQPTTH